MTNATLTGKSYAGDSFASMMPRRGAPLYKQFVSAFVVIVGLCHGAFAGYYQHTEVVDGIAWQYRVEDDVVCIAHAANDLTGDVVIPDRLGGGRVVTIDSYAFDGDVDLTSITFPACVTNIGYRAFGGCKGLKAVVFRSNTIDVNRFAFADCNGLTSVSLPEGYRMLDLFVAFDEYVFDCITNVEIVAGATSVCDGALKHCNKVTSVVIPDSVTSIGNEAFFCCVNLKSIEIPENVTNIGYSAFWGCGFTSFSIPSGVEDIRASTFAYTDLTSIVIPAGVTNIGYGAFSCCSGLESVSIPPSVKTVGDKAFDQCASLVSVSLPQGYTIGGLYPWSLRKIVNVDIAEGTCSICDGAFSGCHNLASIAIPEGVTNIGERAFYECKKLTEVILPSTVKTVGDEAFWDCDNLVSASLPPGYRFWSMYPGCPLTNLYVMAGTMNIGDYAFSYHETLVSVILPEGMTNIGKSAFSSCEKLKTITLPKSVVAVGDYAFGGCTELSEVNILSGETRLGYSCFSDCGSIVSATLPVGYNVSSVYYASYQSLTNLVLAPGTESIGRYGLSGCHCLASVSIPSSVTNIGDYAFDECRSLISVSIPDGVTSIPDGVFMECSGLESVSIPSCVGSIGIRAFENCSSLVSVSIPHGVSTVEYGTFSGCCALRSCSLPSCVTNIGEEAFMSCTNLASIVIPSRVKWIGDSAFNGCSGLTSVTLSPGIETIRMWAFACCDSLVSVTIPPSVKRIETGAFGNCTSLTTVIFEGDAPALPSVYGMSCKIFGWEPSSSCKVYVKEGSTGWGVSIPGTWQNCPIYYLSSDLITAEGAVVNVTGEGADAVVAIVPVNASVTEVVVRIPDGFAGVVQVPRQLDGVKGVPMSQIRVVNGTLDVTEYLSFSGNPETGVSFVVKPEVVQEVFDETKGAIIELDATNPSIRTAATKPGLIYTFSEGTSLKGLVQKAAKTGDGTPFEPEVTVKGGASGFYAIGVGK